MRNPPHPGKIIGKDCLKPLGLTVTAAADALGISRKTFSLILNGHAGITPPMALRLAEAFGGSAERWLRLQMARDLWEARRTRLGVVKRFARHVT